ncbi:alpha/beta hydrolase [Flavobacterium sp. GA093]|uniref:Alpha/beta hydrolase n=1 Tax=Flavobacterium hydrocarbonoxydans TaxID=2683249 RepID=A0A6I4NPH6_9FLAO|nr:alpha/beta hydrolase-fold protein [Flavobacterium hydrocarbonoxydans]MWB96083.1 alpha/beta hydrolase [Flavobacterium hydrocarbonoxydans]
MKRNNRLQKSRSIKKNYFFEIVILFLLLVSGVSIAQKNTKIEIGSIDSLYSKTLGEQRKVWIHLPRSVAFGGLNKQKYPVVYLLDGDAHFSSVVGMIEQLSEINGNTLCPEMIVVGIPNTIRTRDLTPTHSDVDFPFVNEDMSKQSGGGEKFAEFLEKELIPYINNKYPTTSYKTLIGHSFGGLTVMNILTNHTHLFNSYVSIDPSMWWDHEKYLKETLTKLKLQKFSNTSLFLGIANTMDEKMDIFKVRKDTTVMTKHIRSILDLNDFLNQNNKNGLRYKSQYYKEDSHGSVPLIATYDALRFIFDFNQLKLSILEQMNFDRAVFTKIERHYETVSKNLGYKVNVPEQVINTYGYQALSQKNNDLAGYLFKLNVANYPESPNTYDSLGDYYEANGDKKNAIASFQKALSFGTDFPETKQKLEKLLNEK